MQKHTKARLVALNHQFYQNFSNSFAATRRRIQPGIRRLLTQIPQKGSWLDLGCGSGTLAMEWARQQRQGLYLGVDYSSSLLGEARAGLQAAGGCDSCLRVEFAQLELDQPGWVNLLPAESWDGVLSFAVLHHIPGAAERLRLLKEVHSLLPEGACFIHSVWQFQNSPRLLARVLPWETAGFSADELEEGDTLLDWRAPDPQAPVEPALRYVHRFTLEELTGLASAAGFTVNESFEADGQGGKLGLYQVWQAL